MAAMSRAEKGLVGIVSGVPEQQLQRKVRIYKPTRTAMQQGRDGTSASWRMEWVSGEKWANPLMGWTSSADPLVSTKLRFESKEAAIEFASKYGWAYDVDEPHEMNVQDKSYADNFKYVPPPDPDRE